MMTNGGYRRRFEPRNKKTSRTAWVVAIYNNLPSDSLALRENPDKLSAMISQPFF